MDRLMFHLKDFYSSLQRHEVHKEKLPALYPWCLCGKITGIVPRTGNDISVLCKKIQLKWYCAVIKFGSTLYREIVNAKPKAGGLSTVHHSWAKKTVFYEGSFLFLQDERRNG